MTKDGAVQLYYDDSKRLETTSTGTTISSTNPFLEISGSATDSGDTGIFLNANANHWIIKADNYTSGNQFQIKHGDTSSSEVAIACIQNNDVELYFDGSKKFETSSSGATITGNAVATSKFRGNDGVKVNLGDGEDLQIWHSGSHSYIKQDGTGTLYNLAETYRFNNKADTENIIAANANGSVDLYYDNSKKFETSANGASMHGSLYFDDNGKANFGAGSDLKIYHNATNSFIHSGTGNLFVQGGGGIVYLQAVDDENGVKIHPNGAVELYYNDTKTFSTDGYGCKVWNGPTHADAYLHITAGEGAHAYIEFHADEGDDNNDNWQLRAVDGGDFTLRSHANGSWENVWKCLTIDQQHGMYMGALGYGLEGNIDPSGTGNWTSLGCDGQFVRVNGQAYISVDDHFRVRDLDGSNDAERLRFDFQTNSGNAGAQNDWQDDQFDFAEMFEWSDGNPSSEDRIGHTVAVDGLTGKIKIAESGDTVIGVVSGTAAFTANCAGLGWHGQYERDEWGRYIWVEKTRIDGTKGTQFKVNSAFDATKEYVKREDRKEWDKIGIIGQCYVRKAAVIPSSWIKLKEIDSTKDFYLIK